VSGNQQLEALTFAEDLLRAGAYDRGWPAWEAARANLSRYVPHAIPRGFPTIPELKRGFPAPGYVLVLQEGGAGDTFMAARYAADLAAEGARVLWQAPPALASLLRTVPGMWRVYDRPVPIDATVAWVRALSLPARYGVPGCAGVPYVRAPRPAWRPWVRERPRIGVRATSGQLTPGGVDRDLPPAFRERLTAGLLARGYNVVDLDLPAGTAWSVTARLIRSCEAVVSVDTGVAHLAGALGADLRVVLNDRADWRWGTAATTPWYPTARLFRRAAGGSWLTAVLEAIVDL